MAFALIAIYFYPALLITGIIADDGTNYTYDQMFESLDHQINETVFEILRGRCNVDLPFTPSLSLSSSSGSTGDSSHASGQKEACSNMAYTCSTFSIRDMCDMITNRNAPTCSCSADCGNYSSCCADQEFREDDMVRLTELSRTNECRRPYRESRDAFMIRSFCSADWSSRSDSGYTIKDACEEVDRLSVKERLSLIVNGSNFDKDFLSQVLITSIRTAITYKNIFCLVCNFDLYEDTSDDDLLFWPITIKCAEKPESLVADPKWGCIMDHKMNGIRPSDVAYDVYRQSLIPCYADDDGVITDCPRSFTYDTDERMTRIRCGSVFSPVREGDGRSSIYYRNEWCARCHGVIPEAIHCIDGYLPRRAALYGKKVDNPKYDIVIDNMTVTAERRRGGRSERQCKPTEMFDPFIGSCRTLLCHRHEDCRLVPANCAFTSCHHLIVILFVVIVNSLIIIMSWSH